MSETAPVAGSAAPIVSSPPPTAEGKTPLNGDLIAHTRSLWPREVTLVGAVPFAVVYNGRVAGQTVIPAGAHLRLIQVEPTRVEVENEGARQWIAIGITDLVARAERLRGVTAVGQVVPTPSPTASPAPLTPSPTASSAPPMTAAGLNYRAKAQEVTDEIQRDFWDAQTHLYSRSSGGKNPQLIWSGGITFTALVGAARNDPDPYKRILREYSTRFKVTGIINSLWEDMNPFRATATATISITTTTSGWRLGW